MKADTLVFEKKANQVRLATLDNAKLAELLVYDDARAGEGNVYLGKITNKIELANDRFGFKVDIGDGQEAFLNAWEPDLKECNMSQGQSVVVQVAQEKHAEKGAKVVRNIQIVGAALVYKPFYLNVDVSAKIEDKALAQKYRSAVWENTTGQEGWTLRTAAVDYPLEQVLEEMVKLRSIYEQIRLKARQATAPALLYVRENPLYEYIRRYKDALKKIVVNDHHLEEKINAMAQTQIAVFSAEPFQEYGLEDEIVEALNRSIKLKSGGEIHIDQTRAFVTIDVDSASHEGGAINSLNEEAAHEIARQIRLKNLSGKILIDFAGSSEYRYMRTLMDILSTDLADDPSRARILGLSKAGNVEMLRQRRRPSLLDTYTEECPTCQGTGRVEK